MLPNQNIKVIVGMSGGVDSSVAAYLLIQQGYQVEGLFMKNWEQDDAEDYCPAKKDMQDAMAICEKLDIPLHICNFAAEYWDNVFKYFIVEYKAGRTPNPDILCNTEIKFKAFLDYALELGASYIATGHYVKRRDINDFTQLVKGDDLNKDQSYFLHALNQHQLRHALFPIGELTKPEVRGIAEQQDFITADKKDSTGICFIGERKFKDFLQTYIPAQPGAIETPEGIKIGRHDGLMYYTIGQRQGLGIGGLRGFDETPWFVADKILERNVLIAVQGTDNSHLFARGLIAQTPHWIDGLTPQYPLKLKAKIRYRQHEQPCEVSLLNNKLQVMFDEPQRAISPGQSIVFYAKEVCLGGAIIEHQIK